MEWHIVAGILSLCQVALTAAAVSYQKNTNRPRMARKKRGIYEPEKLISQYALQCVEAQRLVLNAILDAYYMADDDGTVRPKYITISQHGQDVPVPLIGAIPPQFVAPSKVSFRTETEWGEVNVELAEKDIGEALSLLVDHHNKHIHAQTGTAPLKHLMHQDHPAPPVDEPEPEPESQPNEESE